MSVDRIKRLKRKIIFRLFLIGMAGYLIPVVFTRWEEARHLNGCRDIVLQVQTGRLRPDAGGDILLPKLWRWLTKNGHVYQTYDKQAGLVLLFPTDVDAYSIAWPDGKTTAERDIAGDLYCPGPLPSDGWFTFSGMSGVSIWNHTQPVHPHWYHVEPFYSN